MCDAGLLVCSTPPAAPVECSGHSTLTPACSYAMQILSVVYGQELPSPDASIGYQVWSGRERKPAF